MYKVLADTNVLIDLLAARQSFYKDAQDIFTLADSKDIVICVSSLSFATTYYILSQQMSSVNVMKVLIKLKQIITVLAVDDKVIELAMSSDFKDFEDAIQYYCANENAVDIIITRNKRDFRQASIPIMTPKEFLKK